QSVTAGIDAMGEVTIRLQAGDRIFSGHGANTDIIVASAQAYLNALNRLSASLKQGEALHPQHSDVQPVS
ncbi:MAG: 2-isopropylmalate synthase, partial [Cyanobacteria bacterium J069]